MAAEDAQHAIDDSGGDSESNTARSENLTGVSIMLETVLAAVGIAGAKFLAKKSIAAVAGATGLLDGEVSGWSIVLDSKSRVGESLPWVQIPPFPLIGDPSPQTKPLVDRGFLFCWGASSAEL